MKPSENDLFGKKEKRKNGKIGSLVPKIG